MRNLFLTAIVLGLFAVTPAAFAERGHNQDNKSDNAKSERAKSGKEAGQQGPSGGNSAAHISDQGRANTNGPNASPRLHGQDRANARKSAQGQFSDTSSVDKSKATKTKRTRNAATANSTRNAAKTNRTRNAVSNNRTRNAVAIDRTPKTIAKGRPANVLALQGNSQSSQRFHAGAYQRPYGYQSRHWRYGERLPSFYFVSSYWINNYMMYALFAPLDGLVWVRVGDDALLIDRYTGEIIRVEYGVFY